MKLNAAINHNYFRPSNSSLVGSHKKTVTLNRKNQNDSKVVK